MTLTRQIGDFVSAIHFEAVPSSMVETVKLAFTDCIAVMFAGREQPYVQIVEKQFAAKAGKGRSSLVFSRYQTDAVTAATINGTAAHALDYDDVAFRGHPSAVLVPAIVAEAEELGAPGQAMIAAYVAGYETWGEIGARLPQPLHRKGWHPTAIFGTIAATAACANLHKLSAEKTANAIAIACSQASGLVANFGSDTKPYHVGTAAASGVMSARLAGAGMTGSHDVMENENGFLAIYGSDSADVTSPVHVGQRYRMLETGISIKRYPVCYGAHRMIDAITEIRTQREFGSHQIEAIHLCIGATQRKMLRHDRPGTPLEAKFSAPFCAAAAAIRGNVGFEELSADFIHDAETQRLMSRVSIETVDEIDPAFSNYSPFDQVYLTMTGGEKLETRRVARAKGHADAPLSGSELRSKFDDCTRRALPRDQGSRLFDRLQALEDVAVAAELACIVSPDTIGGRGSRKASQRGWSHA